MSSTRKNRIKMTKVVTMAILGALLVQHSWATQVIFVHRGTMYPAAAPAEIRIRIRHNKVHQQVDIFQNLTQQLKDSTTLTMDKKSNTLREMAYRMVDVKSMRVTARMAEAELQFQALQRNTRNLINTIGGVLGGLLGLGTEEELYNLEDLVSHIKHDVKGEDQRLNTLIRRTKELQVHYRQFEKLIWARFETALSEEQAAREERDTLANLLWIMEVGDATEELLIEFLDGLHELAQARLPMIILKPKEAQEALRALKDKAVEKGYALVTTNAMAIYSLPTTIHKEEDQFVATVRVPMVKKGAELEIWEYVSVPLLMEDGSYAEPIIDKKWLAIGDGLPEDVMGVTLAEEDLRRCMETEKMWVCPHIKVIQRYPANTCLGSLFFKRWEEARSRCQWKPASSKSKIIAASLGELTFFTLTPVEVAIKCGKEVTTRTITSTQDLDVGRGCEVTTPSQWASTPTRIVVSTQTRETPVFKGRLTTKEIPALVPEETGQAENWNPDSDSEQLDIDANLDMDLESEGDQDPDLGEPAHWSYFVAPLTSVGVVGIVIIGLVWLYKKRQG
jgi:hypothetical protein